MSFTAGQNTVFFTNGPHMDLSDASCQCLALEGLVTVEDFEDFEDFEDCKEDQINEVPPEYTSCHPWCPWYSW